jgi:hypothetical protein
MSSSPDREPSRMAWLLARCVAMLALGTTGALLGALAGGLIARAVGALDRFGIGIVPYLAVGFGAGAVVGIALGAIITARPADTSSATTDRAGPGGRTT